MHFLPPAFVEIKMDAEIGSYQEDDGPGRDSFLLPSSTCFSVSSRRASTTRWPAATSGVIGVASPSAAETSASAKGSTRRRRTHWNLLQVLPVPNTSFESRTSTT